MIEDARVLRDDFIPAEVVHRDAEIQHLSRVLDPLTQEVLDHDVHYINCWQNYSRFRVLYRVLEGLGKTVDSHRQSTLRNELVERLQTVDSLNIAIHNEVEDFRSCLSVCSAD